MRSRARIDYRCAVLTVNTKMRARYSGAGEVEAVAHCFATARHRSCCCVQFSKYISVLAGERLLNYPAVVA